MSTLLFKVLNVFGLPLENVSSAVSGKASKVKEKLKKLTIFWLVIFNSYFVHLCLGPAIYAYRMRSLTEMFFSLSDSFRYGCALLSFNYVVRRHARFNQLYSFVKGQTKSTLKLRLFVAISCILSLVFYVIDLIVNYIEIFESEQALDENIDLYFYNITVLKDHKVLGSVLSAMDILIYVGMTSLVRILLYVYAINVCGIFAVEMQTFLNNLKVLLAKRKASRILSNHTLFLVKAAMIGENFGFLYFVWLSDWMETFFTDVPKLVHFQSVSGNKSVIEMAIVAVPLFYGFVTSLAVTFAFARVEELQDQFVARFHKLMTSLFTNDTRFENELCFINNKLCFAKVRVTFYKFLSVSKLFILNLYSFVSTFSVVAIQRIVVPKS